MSADFEAKQAITEVIYRYCRALDRMDRPLADTVWHPDGTADYGITYRGPAAGLLDVFWTNHAKLLGHSHQVTNILIEVDGARAGSESYAVGTLWQIAEPGILSTMITIGRYLDRWSCRDGVWAIDHRRFVYDASFAAPPGVGELGRLAAERDPRQSASRRDRGDPSYEVMGGSGDR
jgi:hypothetical protein